MRDFFRHPIAKGLSITLIAAGIAVAGGMAKATYERSLLNEQQIEHLDETVEDQKEMLTEIRGDVKLLLQRIQ